MRAASCSEDLDFAFPKEAKAYVSLTAIPQTLRDRLAATGILWMDIEKRERADFGNDAGEEVVQFLRRYGVRFYREGSSRLGNVEAGR